MGMNMSATKLYELSAASGDTVLSRNGPGRVPACTSHRNMLNYSINLLGKGWPSQK